MYVSEITPSKMRGAMDTNFQLIINIGVLAYLVGYFTNKIEGGYGWIVSLAFAAIPAIVTIMGAHYLPETPISLIEEGHEEYTLVILKEIWGVDEEEFYDLIQAREASQQVKYLWRGIVTRKYKPQFFMSLPIPFFQQITGMNALIFYAPVLFQSFGYGGHSSLMSALPLITAPCQCPVYLHGNSVCGVD